MVSRMSKPSRITSRINIINDMISNLIEHVKLCTLLALLLGESHKLTESQ